MSYQAAIDNTSTPLDVVLYKDEEITIISNPGSQQYLEGITIDYEGHL